MNDEPNFKKCLHLILTLGVEEAEKRLERGVVSGATTCYAGASASGGQVRADEEEERSDEPRGQARYAGEGEALLEYMERLEQKASECERLARIEYQGDEVGQRRLKIKAGVFRSVSHDLRRILPKPESDPERSDGERRRNAGHLAPPTQDSNEANQ